jgi:hypothetical protein
MPFCVDLNSDSPFPTANLEGASAEEHSRSIVDVKALKPIEGDLDEDEAPEVGDIPGMLK